VLRGAGGVLELLKDLFALVGGTLGAILLVSLLAGACAGWVASLSVREKGRDRQRLIGWLAPRHWQERYRAAIAFLLDQLVDPWLGDAGRPELSWRCVFGRAPAAPDWTGPALDRCALLAVVYPLLAIVVVWIWAGDAGPVGEALRMQPGANPGIRGLNAVALIVILITFMQFYLTASWRSLLWFGLAVVGAVAVPGAGAGTVAIVVLGAVAVFSFKAIAGAVAVAGAFAVAVAIAVAVSVAVAVTGVVAGSFAVAVAGAGAVAVTVLAERAKTGDWLGRFWLGFGPVALALGYGALSLAVYLGARDIASTLIVTFALLPLVNLPFDFVSVGLTRALLRWGNRPDAPSPFWIGLIDLAAAALLMLPLAAALVIAAQAADAIAFHGAGRTFLNAPFLLDQIEEAPAAAAHAWIYVMLFSTLIPSLINGIIGTASLLTAWPPRMVAWTRSALLAADERPDDWTGYAVEKQMVVAAFAVQAFAAVLVTLGVFWALGWGLVTLAPWLLPALLHAARWVAAVSGGWFGLPPFG